jgi:hypothetical protein
MQEFKVITNNYSASTLLDRRRGHVSTIGNPTSAAAFESLRNDLTPTRPDQGPDQLESVRRDARRTGQAQNLLLRVI